MDKTLKYREKLISILDNSEYEKNVFSWIKTQPDLEQPDLCRVLKDIFIENHHKTGENHWLEISKLIEDGVDEYEEEILYEKLHKNLFCAEMEHALKDAEFTLENVTAFAIYTREALIDSLLSDPKQNSNKKFWEAVHLAIKFEKNAGIYDENNWNAII